MITIMVDASAVELILENGDDSSLLVLSAIAVQCPKQEQLKRVS